MPERLLRGILLTPTLNLLNWILKRHKGNSLIIGGPLGWSWQSTLDTTHHGSLAGPANAHRHSDLADIGIDDHHARDHAARHAVGGGDQVSLDASQIGTGRFVLDRIPGIAFSPSGLVLDLPMGESSGSYVYDLSGTDNNGTIYGASWVDDDRRGGKCLSLDGVDDYVQTGTSGLPTGSSPRTETAWVYLATRSGATHKRIMAYGTAATRQRWEFALDASNSILAIYTYGDDVFGNSSIPTGQWVFVANVWNGSNLIFYINGAVDAVRTFTGVPNTGTAYGLFIGKSEVGNYWSGLIDEARIYNRALSADEVKASYIAGYLRHRTPELFRSHAARHQSGGPDAVALDASQITSGRFGMARMPDGPGGYVLTAQGAGNNPAYAAPSAAGGLSIFGDGSDGDVTISTNTTLTRDMFYNNLTVNSGVTLNTGGYRIFVKETLTNNGTIARNGNNGGNGGAYSGGAAGAALAAGTLGGSVAGGAGGYGVPGWGVSGESSNPGLGGSGGAGGGSGGSGGAGGTVTVARSGARAIPAAISGMETYSAFALIKTGGGGGGGRGSSVGGGGGGGGSGGLIVVVAKNILNSGTIEANGGNGGNAYVAEEGWTGNGGGGGGGAVILVYNSASWGTEQALGGAPGTATGPYVEAGSAGSAGVVIKITNA